MDIILNPLDEAFLTPYVYPSWAPANHPLRELLTLWLITWVGGVFLVLIPDAINYYFFFDHNLMKHKRFLPNQVRQEIAYAMWAIPYMTFLTAVMFVLELHGFGYLYTNVDDHPWGWWMIALTIPNFLFFTDFGIYWIHRWLHHPALYGRFHKPHHKWVICTPFASHAFHPIDGFSQSFPYHLYPFIFPLNKYLYLGLFIFVNLWTVSIHDGIYMVPDWLKPYLNGSAHHTDHHADFNYNYGQYFTLWDRIGGSFKEPSGFQPGKSIYDQLKRQEEQDGQVSDDPFYGIDPEEIEEYAKKNGIKVTKAQVEELKKKKID
jgi:lathosterol oxidase